MTGMHILLVVAAVLAVAFMAVLGVLAVAADAGLEFLPALGWCLWAGGTAVQLLAQRPGRPAPTKTAS
jgi:hypothetical protein